MARGPFLIIWESLCRNGKNEIYFFKDVIKRCNASFKLWL